MDLIFFISQNFLNWRIPSKPMPGQKANDASKAFLNLSAVETQQRFYDDYVGRFSKYQRRKLSHLVLTPVTFSVNACRIKY